MTTITRKLRHAVDPFPQALLVQLTRHLTLEFPKYLAASEAALVVDTAVLLLLVRHFLYAMEAIAGFLIGSQVVYGLPVCFAFRMCKLHFRRWLESSVFFIVGLVALVVSIGVIALCVKWLLLQLFIAELVAVGAPFIGAFAGWTAELFR